MQPSEKARAFLHTVCEQVRWKQAHETITRDLSDHMEDQAEAYVRGGMNRADAAERAVKEMGDPVDVGLLMDASYRPKVERHLLVVLGLLVLAGFLIRLAYFHLTGAEWAGYIILSLIGAGCFIIMLRVNFYLLLKWAWHFQIGLLSVTMALPCLLYAISPEGIFLGFEYAHLQCLWLLYPIIYALVVYRMRGSNLLGLMATGALLAVPLFLRIYMVDPITPYEIITIAACFVITVMAIWMKCFRCNRLLATAVTGAVSALGLFVVVICEPYRLARILGMLDPLSDPLGDGYLTLQIQELIGKSVWVGGGGALSESARHFLEQNGGFSSDYALTILIYRRGFILLGLLLLLILAFAVFGFIRIRRVGSQLGKLLATGILIVLSAQALLYIVPCVGYPVTSSSAFPFVMGRNLYLIFDYLLLGMLFSLFRTDTLFMDTLPGKWKRLRLHISVDAGLEDQ